MVRTILNFGIKQTKRARAGKGFKDGYDYRLTENAAAVAEGPRARAARRLVFYLPEEIEALATALEEGYHRRPAEHHRRGCGRSKIQQCDCMPDHRVGNVHFTDRDSAETYLRAHRDAAQLLDDGRDAAAVRVSAYTGLRLGELLALRWSDIDWIGSALTVSRAVSAGEEGSTKTDKVPPGAVASPGTRRADEPHGARRLHRS